VYLLITILIEVDCGSFAYGIGIWSSIAICSIFVWKFGILIMWFLWCIHNILKAEGLMWGSFFNSGEIVGSIYIIVSGGKCIITCMSSNCVKYGV
jgi:hypothetical protein